MKDLRVVVLGITGMLGHVLFKEFHKRGIEILGTARASSVGRWFSEQEAAHILTGFDIHNLEPILALFADYRPDVVVNCVGIIKQLPEAEDPVISIAVNSQLPHRLALACRAIRARLVHISTDCVFSGRQDRPYAESDLPDPADLYGRPKLLGEVDAPHCITIRTSMIGHALKGSHGLVDWFLSQTERVRGFTNVYFSGLTTLELSRAIIDYVIPAPHLSGIYHVSAPVISKHDLLKLIGDQYGRSTIIEPYPDIRMNRALNCARFSSVTGYAAPPWPDMIEAMHAHCESGPYPGNIKSGA